MTKSFGGPGRQPEPSKRPPPLESGSQKPRLRRADFSEQDDEQQSVQERKGLSLPAWGPDRKTAEMQGLVHAQPQPVKVDAKRRIVALFIDILVCYLAAMIVCWLQAFVAAIVPFVRNFLSLQLVMGAVFLSRDFFFEGRGFGKNLMGYQVVDAQTGVPASLFQSFLRNLILIAPLVAAGVIAQTPSGWQLGSESTYDGVQRVATAHPVGWNIGFMQVVNIIGSLYVLIVFPMEGYRAFVRDDSLRKGDELAGTIIIEAPTDFSHFLPTSGS
jgi:uncharacterized RDD family membrane protein YckC